MQRILGRVDTRLQIAILAVLAAYFMIWPVWRAGFPMMINRNEGWNAYHADAAMGAVPLYPPADALILNNYPPLSFYVVGGLAQLFGDALYVGRVLSLLAVIGLGALIAAVIGRLGGGRAGAAVGGLWFVAVMARSVTYYVGVNDPQLVSHVLMMGALVWFLDREMCGRSVVPPVIAMAAAGFYKHNIVAVPLTALVWITIKDWRRAVWPAVAGAGAAALGLGICVAVYGNAFLANLFNPRIYQVTLVISQLPQLLWILPAVGLWAIWVAAEPRSRAARFTLLFAGIGFAEFVIETTGEGVGINSAFDLFIATAIGLGLAFDRAGKTAFGRCHGETAARAAIVLVVVARLLANGHIESAMVLYDRNYRAQHYANAQVVRDEAARIASIPGPLACDVLTVCRFAGKPFSYDDFHVAMLVATGAAGGLDAEGLMRDHGVTFVRIDPRAHMQMLNRAIIGIDPHASIYVLDRSIWGTR
jgi:hypothetical protein